MKYDRINGHDFYNMVVNASNRLLEESDFVNALNVFPVPDGDTGTNMSMTFKAAVKEIENLNSESIGETSKKLAKGALMGARGNSGVILSPIKAPFASFLEVSPIDSEFKFSISFTAALNVIDILVPVSPSGTGKTFNALTKSLSSNSLLLALTTIL